MSECGAIYIITGHARDVTQQIYPYNDKNLHF